MVLVAMTVLLALGAARGRLTRDAIHNGKARALSRSSTTVAIDLRIDSTIDAIALARSNHARRSLACE